MRRPSVASSVRRGCRLLSLMVVLTGAHAAAADDLVLELLASR